MNSISETYQFMLEKYSNLKVSQYIENQFNLSSEIQFALIALMGFYYIAFGIALRYFSYAFCMLYPAFQSFISLESKKTAEKRRMLLMYWIIISCLNTFELFGWLVISFIPFYHLIKIFFVYWLISPNTQGCLYIYEKFIKEYLKKNRNSIENFLKSTESSISNITTQISDNINKKK